MRKLFLIYKTSKYNTVSSVIRFMIDMFNDKKYRKILLEKYGLEVLTTEDVQSNFKKVDSDFIKENIDTPEYENSILFGFNPYGFFSICELDDNVIKKRNIKRIGWQNDPHYFARFVNGKNTTAQTHVEKIYPIPQLEKLDWFLTPSAVYFKNLNITEYDNKIVDIFYFLNPEYFEKLISKTYSERESRIILSGSMAPGYTSRHKFEKLRKSSKKFEELIFNLKHPGYVYDQNKDMTEWNYYNKLSNFKGAFVGCHDFPLNFLLAKHIEVLMCGCLGFFQPNHLLESQLGLKNGIHYVSCYDDKGLIEDYDFYKKWIDSEEGKRIAKQGQEYVIDTFGEKQINKFFDTLKTL